MMPQIHYVGDIPVQLFDLRGEKPILPARAWSPFTPRIPKDSKGVCLHQMGSNPKTDPVARSRMGDTASTAQAALAYPYHVAVGLTASKTPIVVLAHPPERYLFGGDSSNGSHLQCCVLGKYPFAEPKNQHRSKVSLELRAAMVVGLQECVRLLEEWTLGSGPWELLAHRQACNSEAHPDCPGEGIMGLALTVLEVHPLADLLFPAPDEVLTPPHSKPWPDSWRSHLPSERPPPDVPQEET